MHLTRLQILNEELQRRTRFILDELPVKVYLLEVNRLLDFILKNYYPVITELRRQYDEEKQNIAKEAKIIFKKFESFERNLRKYITSLKLSNKDLDKLIKKYSGNNISQKIKSKPYENFELIRALTKQYENNYLYEPEEHEPDIIKTLFKSHRAHFSKNLVIKKKYVSQFIEINDQVQHLSRSKQLLEENHPFTHWIFFIGLTKMINRDYSKYSNMSGLVQLLHFYVDSSFVSQDVIDYLSNLSNSKPSNFNWEKTKMDSNLKMLTYHIISMVNTEIPIAVAMQRYKEFKQIYEYLEVIRITDDKSIEDAEDFYNIDISKYLHSFGFNPLNEITQGNTRGDVVQINPNYSMKFDFWIESKVFKHNHQLKKIVEFMSQLHNYMERNSLLDGYLVIFLRCKKLYDLPTSYTVNDKTIHLWQIDVRNSEYTGSNSLKPVIYTTEEINEEWKS